jgi:hypothetical protein
MFSPEDDARDAALWREFAQGVRTCLNNDNGYVNLFGGSDNLNAGVQYQSKGRSGLQLTLSWTADNEQRDDIGIALMAMQESAIKAGYRTERAPLPPGTRISYAGINAVVVEDHGGSTLIVDAEDGYRVRWYWTFDGESCVVGPAT